MKLILVHGSLQEAVLNKLSQIRKTFDALSVTEVSEVGPGFNFASPGLFSEKRLIILENPDIKTVEKAVRETDPGLTVLIKINKSLEKASPILKKITEIKGEIIEFNETNQTSIFPLLDLLGNKQSLRSGDLKNKNAFKEFEKNYSQFGGQYLLTMLAYFLRRMVQKPKSSSSFMLQKLESQKKNFPGEKIKSLYKEIIETDFKIKQGLIEEKMGITMLIQKILAN